MQWALLWCHQADWELHRVLQLFQKFVKLEGLCHHLLLCHFLSHNYQREKWKPSEKGWTLAQGLITAETKDCIAHGPWMDPCGLYLLHSTHRGLFHKNMWIRTSVQSQNYYPKDHFGYSSFYHVHCKFVREVLNKNRTALTPKPPHPPFVYYLAKKKLFSLYAFKRLICLSF